MTSQDLNAEQKELVAVGASIGAGCQPCVSHHLKAGAQAGLGGEQLLAAVASAERVSAEAAVAMSDHARAKLGANNTTPALLSRLEEALASLGAALGANDPTNIERQLRAAADLGATHSQLEQAIETAHTVQENAARIHLREAQRSLDALAPATAAAQTDADSSTGCGCGGNDDTEKARVTTEEPEPTRAAGPNGAGERSGCGGDHEPQKAPVTAEEPGAATGSHTTSCGAMATRFAASDAPAAMPGCREMLERFTSAVSPAETDKAPAATTATGGCKKEA